MKKLSIAAMLAAGVLLSTNSRADDQAPVSYLPAASAPSFEHAPAIVEGARGQAVKATVYVFMDPNCVFCHFAWKALQPYEAEGLQVHWIPMGFLKPDSAGKAAALLQSHDGAALLKVLETHYSVKDESGGIAPLPVIPSALRTQLDGNLQVFQNLGFQGTPAIIYQASGGRWADIDGLPKLGMLPNLLNLPAQPVTDPELKQYQ